MTSPREQRRATTLTSIKSCALKQLAERGTEGISLRHVARELGMVSSGIYRYYPSRDALLTDLIIDSYRDLAGALTRSPARHGTAGLVQRALRLRRWAVDQPERFLLVFGTPVAGYQAPQDTVAAAAEVYAALLHPAASPARPRRERSAPALPRRVKAQAKLVAESLELDAPPETVAAGAAFAGQAIGLIVLELNGQLRGTFEPADAFYEDAVRRTAAGILQD